MQDPTLNYRDMASGYCQRGRSFVVGMPDVKSGDKQTNNGGKVCLSVST